MKKFNVGVTFTSWGIVEIEAETLEQAIEYAKNNKNNIELPIDAEYIEDSLEIDDDLELAEGYQWTTKNIL